MSDYKRVHTFPEQRVSPSEKLKEKWYKPSADYKINECISGTPSLNISELYDAAKGKYTEQTFRYVLQPYFCH